MLKLNLGSGESKLEGFVNIDAEPVTHPDICLDFRYDPLPYKDEEVDEVWMLHTLEHVERKYWEGLFKEIHRVLNANGRVVFAYPEFRICADYYVRDYNGLRDYWHATIYGRQLYPTDYHVSAVDSAELKYILASFGFYKLNNTVESLESTYNSVLTGLKAPKELVTDKEKIMSRELNLNKTK